VEVSSNHPIARALVKEAEKHILSLEECRDVKEIPGIGIIGIVDGKEVVISRAKEKGGSMVSISVDGINAGSISLEYRIREGASWMLSSLSKMGIKTAMVTGDSMQEAERIASILGIDEIHAEVLPQEKAQIIRKYQENGDYVLFTGDGINDSVALETADAGISMGSGTDIARESGDIILLNNDLRQIVMARIIGEKTIEKIKQNIGWAVGYNTLLIPVAAGMLVPFAGLGLYSILPMFSALAMGMSSTSVVLNSLLLRNKIGRAWNSLNLKMKYISSDNPGASKL
jgi:Cu2+-exporting ATPase/Cu+-exporting ATPase